MQRTLDYFRALGLLTVAEADGKVYPLSDQASSVLDVLRFAVEQRGVTVVPSCDVIEVKKRRAAMKPFLRRGRSISAIS